MDAPPPRAPWALKLPAGLRASVEVPDGQFLHLQEARLVLPCGSDELDQAVALRGVRVVAAVAERQYELVQLRPPRWFARPQEQVRRRRQRRWRHSAPQWRRGACTVQDSLLLVSSARPPRC